MRHEKHEKTHDKKSSFEGHVPKSRFFYSLRDTSQKVDFMLSYFLFSEGHVLKRRFYVILFSIL